MSLYSRLDRLAADVEKLDRKVNSVSNAPQSQRTSVEGGSIDFNDDDGNLMAIVGSQDDGGNTINVISGPTPPTPVGFTVDVDHGKFIVHWSGDFDGDALAPSDWSRAEVHASQDPFFVPDRTTARGSIVSAAGGEVTIGVLKGPWTIKMLAWSQAGKMSAPSAPVDVEVPGYGEIVLEEIDAAETVIKNANDILVDEQETLGGKLTDAFGQIVDAKTVAERAETAANDAAQDASEAQSAADQAAQDALSAVGIANGKGKIIVQVSKPTGANANVNNLWIDISGTPPKNQPNRYNGTDWVPVTDKTATDAAAAAVTARSKADEAKTAADNAKAAADAAKAAADNAQTTASQALASANGKNVVHYENRRPTASDPGVEGDTWFVGQVGRPNDLVEATNIFTNPSLEATSADWSTYSWTGSGARTQGQGAVGEWFYRLTASSALTGLRGRYHDVLATVKSGQKWTLSIHVRPSRTISLRPQGEFRGPSGVVGSPQYGQYFVCPANVWTRIHMTITAVGDATTVRHQTYLHEATLQSGDTLDLDGEMIALGELSPYFDGDTPSGATDNESHYRWTGTPHASTSEKYLPALDIGDDGTWNVTEQYRYQSGQWVQVELSHTVLSSLDLGKLVAGSAAIKEAVIEKLFAEVVVARMSIADEFIGENAILTGAVTAPKITASEELWAKIAQFVKIRAEHIEADAIDGMVITAPTIQSARSGRRWVASTDSIRVIDENEDVRTELSPDGSTFKGEVEADTLVVNEGAEFKANNTLAQGAKLTLAAGVTDPTSPPVVQPYWDGLEFEPVNMNGSEAVGLAWDGTHYITVGVNKASTGVAGFHRGVYAMKINGTTGESSQFRCDFSAASDADSRVSEVFGVTCIGSELFFLGRYGYRGYVWVTDLAGVFKRKFAFEDLGYEKGDPITPANPLVYKPGIGNDGTNVVIVHCSDDGRLFIRFYNKTTGAKIGDSVVDSADGTKSDVTGVYVGNADWGRKLATVAKARTNQLPSFSPTTGVYDGPATNFSTATSASTGVVFVDGKFRTLDPAGVIHEYADVNTGDASSDWWATYYWYTDVDDDSVIESSDYQSRMAPPKRFTWPRRAGLKIMGQPMPVGVEALGPALAKKTTEPVRTDFSGPGWQVDSGKPSARYTSLPTDWTTYASPSATNTFPEAESSVLESASGTYLVRGDGSGHWGPLKMGRNGVMSGLVASGTVNVAVDADGVAKKFTVNLPPGRFAVPPRVWVQAETSFPQLVATGVPSTETTASTFSLYFYRTNKTTTPVTWFAMDGGS